MRRASSAAAAILAACALAATSVLPAGAASNSKVTVGIGFHTERGNPFFKGRVKSGSRACTRSRVVSVFRVKNKKRVVRFGSTRTNRRGFWRIDMNNNMVPGGYYARAKPRAGCLEDKSREIAIGQSGPGGTG